MKYLKTYESETPKKVYVSKTFVTADSVVVKASTNELLLIRRKNEPFKGHWALPGGFLDFNEDLEAGAIRELEEETKIVLTSMKQIGAFGKPGRDPRGHMVAVAYYAEVDDSVQAEAADDAAEIGWFPLNNLPELAFDHGESIKMAIERFR